MRKGNGGGRSFGCFKTGSGLIMSTSCGCGSEAGAGVDVELSSQVMSCKKLSLLSFILIELVAVDCQVTTRVYPAEGP